MYTMSAPATLRSVPPALARRFFGVAVRPQTYLNLLYLALLFPLGLTYFVALTVGFAFSLALSITNASPTAAGIARRPPPSASSPRRYSTPTSPSTTANARTNSSRT
jgi:hypothetical protein